MLKPKDINGYGQQLRTLLDRVQRNVEGLREETLQGTGGEASGGLSNLPLHPADLGNRQFESDVNLGLVGNEEGILGEVHAALARIDDGTYGTCGECGRAIGKARLDAVPYARLCLQCAE